MSRTKSIGVFDSGLGGLTVLRAVMNRLPQYRYIYLGDNARAPYGDRTQEEVLQFATQAIDYLFAEDCELVLFACNTVSAEALRAIQQEYLRVRHGERKRVLGVIVPTLEYVASDPSHKKVGILGTHGTVRSGTYPTELSKIAPHISIVQNAAPLLVPLVEAGEHETEDAYSLVCEYVNPLIQGGVDTIVLACTHYEHLKSSVERAVGPAVKVVPQSEIIADKLSEYLARHPEIESVLAHAEDVRFVTTDTTGRFESESARFFGRGIKAEHVTL